MRSSPASALANNTLLALVLLGAATGARAEMNFKVVPSTVVAGRSLAIYATAPLREARVSLGGRTAEFYPVRGRWRALVGVASIEEPGPRTGLVQGITARGEPFEAEVAFHVARGTYPVGKVRMSAAKTSLYTTGAVDRDGEFLAAFYSQPGSPEKLWTGPFVRPSTGVVTSLYGSRRTYTHGGLSLPHSGTDLAAPAGSPVRATQDGRVAWAGWLDSLGNVALLDHGHGVYGYFLHMRALSVASGQIVKTGDLLGEMGMEGVATGPHVHWTMVVGGERVDPFEWTERHIP